MEYDRVLGTWRLGCLKAQKAGQSGYVPFDHETAGGVITRDYLRQKLTEVVPDDYQKAAHETLELRGARNTVFHDVLGSTAKGGAVLPAKKTTAKGKKKASKATSRTKPPKKTSAAKMGATSKRAPKRTAPVAETPAVNEDDSNNIRKRLRPRKA